MSFACKHSSIEIQTQSVLRNRLPNNVMNYNRLEVRSSTFQEKQQ